MKNILLIGGRSGIGHALAELLVEKYKVVRTSRSWPTPCDHQIELDVCDEVSIMNAVEACQSEGLHFDAIINCAGMLHTEQHRPEKSVHELTPEFVQTTLMTNALGHLLVLKHFKPLVIKSPNPLLVSLSARIGSIEDNRLGGWYSYRMSKAALNMGMKTLAIEWRRSNPKCSVLLLHPGTTDTQLSQPFQKGLPAGQLQIPAECAGRLNQVIINHWAMNNCPLIVFKDHNGQPIPW